mgnify:CR=1 FL=1
MLNNEGENRTQLLQTILDTSPNCIYVKDKQGRYIIANKAIAKLYQTTPDEMIGKKDEDFADQAILKPDEAEFFKDIDKKAIETKETQTIPCESFTYNDGTNHYFFTKKIPITYQDDPDCVMGISVDITKLKESQKHALESEEKFRQAFEKSTIGHSLTKPDGTLSQVNSAFASMLGYTVEELSKMNFEDITHPDDIAESNECTHCLLSGEKDCFRFDKRYIHKNGTIVWTDVSTILLRDSEKEPLFFITSIQDITEKKKVEEELKETLNATTDGIWTWNFKTDTLFFSDRYYQMLGYEPQEFEANFDNWANLIHPDDKERAIAVAEEYLKHKPDVYENIFRLCTKQGTYRWIRSKARVVERDANGEAIRMIGTHEDITEKEKIQQQLKHSEEKYRHIFELSPVGICTADKKGRITDINQSGASITGHSREELIGKSYKELHFIDKKMILNILKDFPKILQGKPLGPLELNATDLEGNDHIVEVGLSSLRDDGKFIGTQVTMNDITEKKKAEKKVKESEEKYRGYIDNAPNGVFIGDETGRYLEVNDKAVEITGYSRDELLQMSVLDTLPEEGKEIGLHHFQTLLNEGKSVGVTPFVHKDGSVRWWQVNAVKISENRFLGFTQDITEKREMEQKLQRIFDMSSELICEADINTAAFTKINPAFTEVLGYSEEELLAHSFLDFIHPDDKEPTQTVIDEQLQRGEKVLSFINRYRCKDGSYVWLDWNSHPVPENGVTYAIARDITDEKKAEDRIHSLSKIVEQSTDGIVKTDKEFKINYINPAAEKLFGYTFEELKGKTPDMFNAEPQAEVILNELYSTVSSGKTYIGESLNVRKDGTKFYCQYKVSPLKNDKGGITEYIASQRDITDEKMKEKEIIQSKKETEMILNTAADGIRIVTKDFKIKTMNDTFAEMVGITREEGVGQYCYDVFKSADCDTDECAVRKVMRTGEGIEKETIRTTLDNREIPCIFRASPYKNENGEIIGVIEDYRDITDIFEAKKQIQTAHEKLQESNRNLEGKVQERTERIQMLLEQKDDFINQLGHDIKNPLGPLVNLLPILENKVTDPKQKDMIRVMNRNVSYIKNLVTRTIQLAQLKSPSTGLKYEEFDLGKEIQDIVGNHQLHFDEKQITVENKIPENMMISADILKMQEVFNNLLNNAVKYNKQDGAIIIEHCVDNNTLTISIKDTGVGMTSEQLERVFDEFYKADSSRHDFDSSGLGMPITKRIIELHGGRIWAESEGIDEGSTFYFTIPVKTD